MVAHVQTLSAGVANQTVVTITGVTTTAGNTLVATAGSWRNLERVNHVITSSGHTFVENPSSPKDPSSNTRSQQFYAKNIPGGTNQTFTCTLSAAGYCTFILTEIGPADLTAPFDVHAGATGISTTPSSGATATRTQADEILIGSLGTGDNVNNGTITAGSGFTIPTNGKNTNFNNFVSAVEYQVVSSVGTQAATFTISSDGWSCLIGTYKASGGAQQFDVSVSGTVAPTGAIIKSAQRLFAGASTPAGAIARQVLKVFSGSVTPAGALANIKTILLFLAGTVASSGALVRSVAKGFAGAVTSAGALIRQAQKALAGTVTPSGAVALIKSILITLTGSVASAGSLVRQVGKNFAGTIAPTGSIARHLSVTFSGTVAASGLMFKSIGKIFAGVVASLGALVNQFLGQLFIFNPPLNFEVTIVRAVSADVTVVQGLSFEVTVG